MRCEDAPQSFKEDFSMKWIFIVFSVGSIGLLTAQLVDYIVESRRVRAANVHRPAFSDVPPGDALPSAEIAARYDQAA
jgi:hypothetical protein